MPAAGPGEVGSGRQPRRRDDEEDPIACAGERSRKPQPRDRAGASRSWSLVADAILVTVLKRATTRSPDTVVTASVMDTGSEGIHVSAPLVPGWYPDPKGGRGKRYWDGSEWHTAVPSARRRGGRNISKVVVGVGLFVLVVSGAAGAVVGLNNRDEPQPSSTADPNFGQSPTPTPPRYLSEKAMQGDGMYRVGGDQVDPGVWESEGPSAPGAKPCSWARLSAPQNTPEATVEAGGSPEGPARVRVAPTDAAFFTDGCLPWRLVER